MSTGEADFLAWAGAHLVPLNSVKPECGTEDLAALGRMIGDASIVVLSEGVHGAAEPLEFRNRVLQYLVQEKGFTAIALESGLVESRVVYDYVRGGPGSLPEVLTRGIGWTFDRLPQNHALVRWLRDYNAEAHRTRKINFYGFDVPGSPGNPHVSRGPTTALVEVLGYLDEVDGEAGRSFHARFDGLLPNIHFDFRRPAQVAGYDELSQAQRDLITAALADLVTLMERREAHYTAASTADAYAWAYRAAIGARQADGWLRQVPLGWRPPVDPIVFPSEETRIFAVATDVRDRALADNLDWIVAREGPAGKILVYASHFHSSTAPVKTSWRASEQARQQVAGTYLRRRYAERLLSIGNLIAQGEYAEAGVKRRLGRVPPDSIDAIAAQLGVPLYLLDLRSAPAAVRRWLKEERPIGPAGGNFALAVGWAFDVVFYVDTVTLP